MVKRAKGTVACGHAPADATAFFEQGDAVARLQQGASASDSGQTAADDGDAFGRCRHVFSSVMWFWALYTLQWSRLALIAPERRQVETIKSKHDYFTQIL
jgi:hypothetical protein